MANVYRSLYTAGHFIQLKVSSFQRILILPKGQKFLAQSCEKFWSILTNFYLYPEAMDVN